MKTVYLPALRGVFGKWVYYSALVQLPVLAERVTFAEELHRNKELSQLIQRELKKRRAKEIATYLGQQNERFFNSLVVAVYGGSPTWHEMKVSSESDSVRIEDVSDAALHSLGFLRLSGTENLFALDGQHRLAGIKKALPGTNELRSDEASVLFVAHENSKAGLQRTRRLFTTLNKTAKPVSKGEIIALDEDDAMAITVRRLVEEHPYFAGKRVVYTPTNNLPVGESAGLTTIGALYDVLNVLFTKVEGASAVELRFNRPDDDALQGYYNRSVAYFRWLGQYFETLGRYFRAKSPASVVRRHRGSFGGSVLFRPIGLILMTEVVASLPRELGVRERVKRCSRLPQELSRAPYVRVLWDPMTHTILPKGRLLARRLLLYMLGIETGAERLREDYAAACGVEPGAIDLPPVVGR